MVSFSSNILVIVLNLIVIGNSERTKDKMFNPISGASCYKRLNATHETGCSSSLGGSVGVLHLIKTASDFDFVTNNPPAPPYAVVVTPDLFTRANILPLKDSPYISAIVLINNYTNLSQFSQELSCPNQYSGFNKDTCDIRKPETLWNPFGTGLMHEHFPYPIYYVAAHDEIAKIINCTEKFNNFDLVTQHERSLCSIQINAFMSAAVNSEVCLRRTSYSTYVHPQRYCDPLQGKNVYATLFPRQIIDSATERKVQNNEKFILVTARMDTTSMFDGVGLGAMELMSFATLVSTAQILATILPTMLKPSDPNVLFVLFNGESYDYIGSQRFVYDLSHKSFPPNHYTHPISSDNIELMIDIGSLDDVSNITLYRASEFAKADKLITLLQKYNQQYHFNITTELHPVSNNLPPTSAQSFLRENSTFPAVILNGPKSNRFYHSIYDDTENINYKYYNTTNNFTDLPALNENGVYPHDSIQMAIRNVSSLLAFSLFEMITGAGYQEEKGGSPVLVDEILFCYLKSANCPLFRASYPKSLTILPIPPLRYVSVQGSYTHEAVVWAYRVLGFLVGHRVELSENDCAVLPLDWYNGVNGTGECRLTTQNLTQAFSPAFLVDNYNWTSGRYSTWTESTWRELNARIFLKPSTTHEAFTFAIGFVVMMLSFVIVFLVNSKSDVLFGESISSNTVNTFVPSPAQC